MSMWESTHEDMWLVRDGEKTYDWIKNYKIKTTHEEHSFYVLYLNQ
jgi:hypothetical protein